MKMPKKEKEENKEKGKEEEKEKEIRIISERVNVPFKEIKKQEENLEENLEEETEEEFQEFTEFVSGERTSPVLSSAPAEATEPIERSLENAPPTTTNRTSREGTSYAVNMPDYTSGNYENARREEERRIEIRNAHAQRREDALELRQMPQQTAESEAERAGREIRKYQEVRGIKEEEEERRIPGRRRERRERVLKL